MTGTPTYDDIPPLLYAQARGARLAYQVFGQDSPTILAVPPLAQNIEVAWEQPKIRRMLERFGSWSRFIHFDKRGTGASDRRSAVPGIDERVEDIRAVLDAVGVESAHLFVQSDGGPMAIMFAVTYPHRVESLILCGSGATMAPDWPEAERIARRDRQVAEWGTPQSRMVDGFAPSLADDGDFRRWHQRYERLAATTDSLRELLDLATEMDVSEVLSEVTHPTLVLHRTGDLIVPVEKGRDLAARIPGAELIEYEGNDHFSYVGSLEWMDDVERFITGSVTSRPPLPRPQRPPHIVTFGRFAVEVDGEEVPISAWGSRHARQVLKRLVAADGWPVTREALIDMLWPDEHDMRKLSARLSVQLSAIRRVLGGGVIANRESVRLDLDAVTTDLHRFLGAGDKGQVEVYDGEFLPEDLYEDWTGPLRDDARRRFAAAAQRLGEAAMDAGDHDAVVELARRVVDVDAYNEIGHRLLVDALIASGDLRHARLAHESWARAMAELDLEVESFETLVAS